ncbi:TRAF-like [Arabidopsis thaliana x Arabidopsis arenosa]|uniref:TRAF-like n=1 Tax=Arabidopsis thaliana x Arabidopsis arenosa TaxID=1240361 RepID=A0A8T2AVZ7_9BRAS|nr:TRAF-like [Arabidopsis thaliana x Arabidopsis arenosa]
MMEDLADETNMVRGENATKTILESLNVDENNEKVYEEQEVDDNKEDKEKEDEDDEEERMETTKRKERMRKKTMKMTMSQTSMFHDFIEVQMWFDHKTPNSGSREMILLTKLLNKNGGFLVNGDVKIVAEVDVLEVTGKSDVLEEISFVRESTDVNGLQVIPSQLVESVTVSSLFKDYPDIESKFCPTNPHLRTSCMNILVSLTDILCQSHEKLSIGDLADAYSALRYVTKAGFKLNWLEEKLKEAGKTRLQEIEEDLKGLKQKLRSMETKVDTTITWVIKDFSSLQSTWIYSDKFVVDGCKWRLLVYPKGNNKADYLSLYLDVPDKESLPIGWRRHTKVSLTIVNHSETLSQLGETQHWFDQKSSSWGFPGMIPLSELQAKKGFLVNGELKVVAKIDVLEVVGKLDVPQESIPVLELIDVNGFQVLPPLVESVSNLFKDYPDIASKFRTTNPHLRTTYMNVLLSLTEILCKSPQKLSIGDLSDAYTALRYVTKAGFKLNWLEEKLKEAGKPRLQEIEDDLNGLKQKCADMEALESPLRSMETKVDTTITWVMKNFSSLQSAPIYSDKFVVGGCKWRFKAFPKGNKKADIFSLYLDVPNKESLPTGWRRHAKFSLTLVNKISEKLSQLKEGQEWFDQKAPDWGFQEMISLTQLHAKEGFLVNGELIVAAKVEVLEVVGKLDVSEESSPVTIVVNGFQVLPSQVESVKSLFERHLDIASNFRPKNPYLKTAYMNVLLSLTQTICQSPQELSNDDLSDAGAALAYLREAGFELDWLEKKLDEVKEKIKKEEACLARIQEIDEQLQPFKKTYLDLEAQIDKEKEELLAARAPLSLYDENVV